MNRYHIAALLIWVGLGWFLVTFGHEIVTIIFVFMVLTALYGIFNWIFMYIRDNHWISLGRCFE